MLVFIPFRFSGVKVLRLFGGEALLTLISMLRISSAIWIVLIVFSSQLGAQEFSLVSWNIRDFGKSKDEQEIAQMADILGDYDIHCYSRSCGWPRWCTSSSTAL